MNRIIDDIFGVDGRTRRALLKSAAVLMGTSILKAAASAFAADMNYSPGSTAVSAKIANQSTPAAPMPKNMMGFMLAHEQFTVPELIRLGVEAEQAGFDLLATSDHLQPWQANEKHSGEAWVTMAVLGAQTRKVWI
jgi:Luciferase-like monooxygenase